MSLFKASLVSKIILIFLKIDQNLVSYFKKNLKKGKNSYTKGKISKKYPKRSVKERKSKNSMLVNPPPHLSHALSSMYELIHKCMKKKKGKKNITLRWWFRWWSNWSTKCDPIYFLWSSEEPTRNISNITH